MCTSAAALIRSSFAGRLHPIIPLCQDGAAAALRAATETPSSSRRIWTESSVGTVEAIADVRLNDETLFLSYLVVAMHRRGEGLATHLLESIAASATSTRRWELDVFASNGPALSFYRKLGFVEIARTSLWRMPVRGRPSDGSVVDLDATRDELSRFGFSYVRWSDTSGVTTYGMPSAQVARVALGGDTRLPRRVIDCLPEISTVLLPLDSGAPPPPEAELIDQSVRLQKEASAWL